MSITEGHFSLSKEQRRFKRLIEPYPKLKTYWDFDKRDCHIDKAKSGMNALSSGEQILLRFFMGVWLGNNEFDFDVIDAAKTLGPEEFQVIANWVSDPWFP